MEVYNCFSSLASDHRVLTAKIKLSLRMTQSHLRKIRYDWAAWKDPELLMLYTVTVKTRYSELTVPEDEISQEYGKFVKASKDAAVKLIPQKKKNRRKEVVSGQRINADRRDVQDAFSVYQLTPTSSTETARSEGEAIETLRRSKRKEELEELVQKVEEYDSTYRHGRSWMLINEITGRKGAKRDLIKGNCKEERIKLWYDHFNNLLDKRPEIPDEDDILPVFVNLRINDEPFTIPELSKAKKSLYDGKASGPDDTPPDVIKRCYFE